MKQNPRYSILLSLHDRNLIDLQKTFQQLCKMDADRNDTEYCVVFDFADAQFPEVEELVHILEASLKGKVKVERYDTVALHPETFHLDTHCNPVAVNNKLMDMATGDNLLWISSDMIVSPLLLDRIDLHIDPDTNLLDSVYCSRVIDQDSMSEFCGLTRPFPMMWCVSHPHSGEGQYLELLKGFGYDDNDWMARMGIKLGSITIDLCHIAIHQTHGKVSTVGQLASGKAYSEEAAPGWEASGKYIKEKWGGVPFDGKTLDIEFGQVGEYLVLNVAKKPQLKLVK